MRVTAAPPEERAASYLSYPVITVPAVWEAFQKDADAGNARWGACVAPPDVQAAQPPPAPPRGFGACVRAARR